ncbi:MAG: pitrilysin family protein [Thermoanaerobaculia bacterium]
MAEESTTFRDRAPQPAPPRPYHFPKIRRVTLENGLRVLIAQSASAPLVAARMVVHSGGDRDPAARFGLAALAGGLLDEGAGDRDTIQIAEAIGLLGGSLGSGADWDASYVYLDLLSSKLEAGMDVFADVVLRPRFEEGDLERLRNERLTEILQGRDEAPVIASNGFARAVYGGTPYGNPLIGTEDSVAAITRDDVLAFYRRHYVPNNASLVIAGDLDADRGEEMARRLFGKWKRGEDVPAEAVSPRRADQSQIYLIDRPESVQSEIRIGHPGVPRNCEDYFPLTVMNAILGGVFTSRLNLTLREKHGYTYGIRSAFAMRRHAGPFLVSTAVRNDVTAAAAKEILREVAELRDGEVRDEELSEAKNYLMGVFPATVQTPADVASRIQEMELYGLPHDYFDHYRRRLGDVTKDEIRRVAEKYLDPSRAAVVVVGKAAEIQPSLNELGRPLGLYDIDGKPKRLEARG